jgi:predicted glycosyltransferase
MHAAADVVVIRGGYNSLLEACVGSANIVVVPIPGDFEQQDHARRLRAYRDLTIIHALGELDQAVEALMTAGPRARLDGSVIQLAGVDIAAKVILDDLLASKDNTQILAATQIGV